MAGRVFEKNQIVMAGKRIGAFTLRCSHPLCMNSCDIINRSPIKSCSAAKLRVGFENKGWYVGDRLGEDLCPEHAKAAVEARRQKRRPSATNLRLVSNETDFKTGGNTDMPTIEPPKQMTREDKRIINAKLHDVYINEREGYQKPWTDKTVADDLGVPMAWIVEIREELFGPACDNSEIRDYLERAEKAKVEAAETLAKITQNIIVIERAMQALPAIKKQADEIQRHLDLMTKTSERIAKAVAV